MTWYDPAAFPWCAATAWICAALSGAAAVRFALAASTARETAYRVKPRVHELLSGRGTPHTGEAVSMERPPTDRPTNRRRYSHASGADARIGAAAGGSTLPPVPGG